MIDIKIATHSEIVKLKSSHNESVDFKFNPKTHYLAAYDDGEIVGCVGWMRIGKNIRYKTDYVRREYRGRGIYSSLWSHREHLCANQSNITTAFCTPMSIGMYTKNGFVVSRDGKIKFVTRKNS